MAREIERLLATQQGDVWLRLGRGLEARRAAEGAARLYFRYTHARRAERVAIGIYDPNAPAWPTSGPDLRSRRAATLDAALRTGRMTIATARALIAERLRPEATRAIEAGVTVAELRRGTRDRREADVSLGSLLGFYWAKLAARGAPSLANTRGRVMRHVAPWLSRPAAEIRQEDIRTMLARIHGAGLTRTVGIVRAALGAAFEYGLGWRSDPTAPAALAHFDLTMNPVRGIRGPAMTLRDRVLSDVELRSYREALAAEPESVAKIAALAHLLLAGQRPVQLLRARREDYDREARTLTLWDPKGRRPAPRRHVLPVSARVASLLGGLPEHGPFLFPVQGRGGPTALDPTALAKIIATVSRRAASSPFTPGDLRRTAETRLAALRVSIDVRAHLLSHGLSGVQARHYDRYEYIDEKAEALARWERLLHVEAGAVIALRPAQ